MSYLVLARKWRPLTFDDVVGQEHITRTLRKAIEMNRVAHAYIFSGTRGVGKTTTARILVRALNCEKGPTSNPCGECDSCKSILSGSSFDVLEIDGASNNKVEDIRELRDNINYSSMGGKHRIFIIDEVHMLTKQAFNALLKTLEEPPKNVIFIFATTEPNKIPETIHSRCQRYDFRRLTTEQILNRLVYICDTEKIPYEREGLMLVARRADGSMRDGLSLLDQVYSFCPDKIVEKEVRAVLGLTDVDVYRTIVDALADRKPAPVMQTVQEILYQGNDLHEFILGLEEHLRKLLFGRFEGILDNKWIDLHVDSPEVLQIYKKQSARFSEGTLLRMIEIVRKAENELKWSAFPRLAVEIALVKLAYLDSTVSVEHLLEAFKNGESLPEISAPAPTPELSKKKSSDDSVIPSFADTSSWQLKPAEQPKQAVSAPLNESAKEEPGPESAGPPPEPESVMEDGPEVPVSSPAAAPAGTVDLHNDWPKFIDALMHDWPNLGSFLSLAYVVSAMPNSVDVKFPSQFKFQHNEVLRKENRDAIEKMLNTFAGRPIELHITIETQKSIQARANEQKSSLRIPQPRSIEDDAEKEPIISAVLDLFDGEVLA